MHVCVYIYIYSKAQRGPGNRRHKFGNGVLAETAKRKAGDIGYSLQEDAVGGGCSGWG